MQYYKLTVPLGNKQIEVYFSAGENSEENQIYLTKPYDDTAVKSGRLERKADEPVYGLHFPLGNQNIEVDLTLGEKPEDDCVHYTNPRFRDALKYFKLERIIESDVVTAMKKRDS